MLGNTLKKLRKTAKKPYFSVYENEPKICAVIIDLKVPDFTENMHFHRLMP